MISDETFLYLLLSSNMIAVGNMEEIKKKSRKLDESYRMQLSDFTLYSPLEYKILGFLEVKSKVCVYFLGNTSYRGIVEYERMEHLMKQNLGFKSQVVSLVR